MVVPLDAREQTRFDRLIDGLLLIDMHQHTMVMPRDLHDAFAYAASYAYEWGYDAIRAGRWSAVGAACNMGALMRGVDGSSIAFLRSALGDRTDAGGRQPAGGRGKSCVSRRH
jgi:hypothetical protein